MNISIFASPSSISMLMALVALAILGIGIYIIFLAIKALRLYIKKNS